MVFAHNCPIGFSKSFDPGPRKLHCATMIVGLFTDVLNVPLKQLIGTEDPMSMFLKIIIFILIYQYLSFDNKLLILARLS